MILHGPKFKTLDVSQKQEFRFSVLFRYIERTVIRRLDSLMKMLTQAHTN